MGLALALVIGWSAAWIAVRIYGRIFRTAIQKNIFLQETRFIAPLRLLFFATSLSLGARIVSTLLARLVWSRLSTILMVTAFAWLFLRIIDFASLRFTLYLRRTRAQHQIAAVQLFRGAAKALTIIIAVLAVLKTQGVDLSTAIAGLGIGGLALAFAAQKTIENLFGTVTLVADQPVRVGDFCRIGDTLGTIENIGLRSTRIRTLNRTVVSVPNGQVASMILENFAPRDKMWFSHKIGLRYETTADQLRYVLANIRAMLYAHPRVESESARIRFVRFGDSSLDLEIFAYVSVQDNPSFLEIQEDLLLRIMDIVETSGTGIAFPSQTTYLAKDTGLDSEKSEAAVAQVKQWREKQNLPFPNHSPETIMKIQDSLDYPPPESAVRKRE